MMNRIQFFILIYISLFQLGCNSNKELISNAGMFDHVLVGYMKKRAFYVLDQEASGQIELVQELKGVIRTSASYVTPCSINRQGEQVSILESPSELKDLVCIRYYIGPLGKYKPQSFMITRVNPKNDCESEVLLFFNEERVDTFSSIGDTRLKCYHLPLFSNTSLGNEEFLRIKQRLLKKIN